MTTDGHNIPFVNSISYLGVSKITWRLHIETVATKSYRTFIRFYFLFKSDRLSTNSKLTLHKALSRSITTYACPTWEFAADVMKLQRLQTRSSATLANFQGTPRFVIGIILSNSIRIRIYNQIMRPTSPSHSISREYTCSQ
jgi:hypothetical protein